jgi:phage baseplate assembly protein V
MFAELKRQINNLVSFGTISQTKSADGKSLARVKLGDRESDFLPSLSLVNSFFKVYSPMRVGEQVVVVSPFGEASGGFILRSIFNRSFKEPSWADDTTAGVEFEDGTTITYNTSSKELKIDAVDKITIICESASVTADDVTISANTVDIIAITSNTGDVNINGKLTVTDAIVASGGIAVSGGSGASFDGDISSSGSLDVGGSISDSKGDLTNHTNNNYSRD